MGDSETITSLLAWLDNISCHCSLQTVVYFFIEIKHLLREAQKESQADSVSTLPRTPAETTELLYFFLSGRGRSMQFWHCSFAVVSLCLLSFELK